MSLATAKLHQVFINALGAAVVSHSATEDKPLLVDLALPHPPQLRVYLYNLVSASGTVRAREFKIVLRLRGQLVGQYGRFDYSDGRFVVLAGYSAELDVFVFWDSSLHPRFKAGGNVQVRDSTVYAAVAGGMAEQPRPLQSNAKELVLACRSRRLADALNTRVITTGGVA